MSDYIVEMNHITKRFPGIVANDDVTIKIKQGEIYAILGENGAGKSTLMSMLFGMYEPDEGEIIIRGEKVRIESPNHATKLNIGMVHQHFKLVSNYTVAENIIMGEEPQKKVLGLFPVVDMETANQKVKELSDNFGLFVDPTKIISECKVYIQQRVEILKMLYREAEILIFDEPTAVLTPQEIDFFLGIVGELRANGKTIILITHKLNEIKRIADRCAILRRGKLIDVLDVATTDIVKMANLMVGHEISLEITKNPPHFGEEVLRVENLCVETAGHFKVVDNLSFSIRKGELFVIAGVSGNGQIELADAIAGLVHKSSGNIYLNGREISELSIRERCEAGISYIPEDRQSTGVVMDFDLASNTALKKHYKKPFASRNIRFEKVYHEYAAELIEKYDIRCANGSKTILRSMSGGNQQKAIVGREIELNGDLLIIVQPTRGLDIGAINLIHDEILEQRDQGKAILLISLDLDEVMGMADTIGIIYNGKLQKIAPQNELTHEEVGQYMMGVGKK